MYLSRTVSLSLAILLLGGCDAIKRADRALVDAVRSDADPAPATPAATAANASPSPEDAAVFEPESADAAPAVDSPALGAPAVDSPAVDRPAPRAPAPTPSAPTPPTPVTRAPAAAPEPATPPVIPFQELQLTGLEPLSHASVPGQVGQSVWVTSTRSLSWITSPRDRPRDQGEVWVYTGQELTLVQAEPFGRQGEFNYVRVRTQDGQLGEIQTVYLSLTPLRFDLSRAPRIEALLQAAFEEAVHVGARLHALRRQHAWDVPSEGEDAHLERTYEEAFKGLKNVVHSLIHGSNRSEADLMREGGTRWLALADDERLLERWSDGVRDATEKRRLTDYKRCLDSIENLDYHGHQIAAVERERSNKSWRRGMKDLPPAKVEQLERKELAELDERRRESEERLAKTLDEVSKSFAALRTSE